MWGMGKVNARDVIDVFYSKMKLLQSAFTLTFVAAIFYLHLAQDAQEEDRTAKEGRETKGQTEGDQG